MKHYLRFCLPTISLAISSCQSADDPCQVSKPLVIEGYTALAIQSQWDACVANNASVIALSNVKIDRLSEITYELCASFESLYLNAIMMDAPKMPVGQAENTRSAYSDTLKKMAKSEILRVRASGCFRK